MKVTTQLIKVALGFHDEDMTEAKREYDVGEKIPKKGSMYHVKDVPDPKRRAYFQF